MRARKRASESNEQEREKVEKPKTLKSQHVNVCAFFVHCAQSSIARTNLHRSPWFEWVSSVTQTMCWCVKLRQEITFKTCYHRIAYVAVHKQKCCVPSKTHSTIAICISSEREYDNSFCVCFFFRFFSCDHVSLSQQRFLVPLFRCGHCSELALRVYASLIQRCEIHFIWYSSLYMV